MKHSRPSLIALCLFVVAGCAAAPGYLGPDRVPVSAMKPQLQYHGFVIARPQQPAWYTIVSEQSYLHGMLRRELPSPTHTAFVSVELHTLPRAATSSADFASLVRQDKISDTQRFELISYHQRVTTFQGQWAVAFNSTTRDLGARNSGGQPLTIRQTGFVVLHPAFPNSALLITYSERGTPADLDSRIESEGDAIIRGVRLESTPGQTI